MYDYCTKCGTKLIYRRATGIGMLYGPQKWHKKNGGTLMYAAELACPNKRHWRDLHFRKADFCGDSFYFPATDFDKDGIYKR